MAIDAKMAAKIAKEEGLDITHAAALKTLANDEEEARELARSFRPDETKAIVDDVLGKAR